MHEEYQKTIAHPDNLKTPLQRMTSNTFDEHLQMSINGTLTMQRSAGLNLIKRQPSSRAMALDLFKAPSTPTGSQ